MIDLDIKKMVYNEKIIDLDIRIFTNKTIMTLILEIDGGNIYVEKVLLK